MSKRPKSVEVGEIRARAVRPRGKSGPADGRWYWRAEVARRMVWRGWATRTELPRVLAELLVEGVAPSRAGIEDVRTVRDLMEVWIFETGATRKATTQKATRDSARRVAVGIGSHRLDRLSRLGLDQWVAHRKRDGHANTTIHRDLGTLRQAWTWGRQVGVCPHHDLPLPRVRPLPKRPKRTPTLAEVGLVLRHFEEQGPMWVTAAIRLQAAWGCRIGELGSLTWADVSLERRQVTLNGKTGRRVLPLRGDLAALIDSLPRTRETVLGRTATTVSRINEQLHNAADAVGVERFTTHGLRRLAVDTLARSGVDVGTAAAMLGHSPAVMLSAYRQVNLDDLRAAAESLGRIPRGEVVPFRTAASGHNPGSQHGEKDDDV